MRDINDVPEFGVEPKPEWSSKIVTPLGQTVNVTSRGTVTYGPGQARLVNTTSGAFVPPAMSPDARWYRAALREIADIDVTLSAGEKCMHMRRIARLALGEIFNPSESD